MTDVLGRRGNLPAETSTFMGRAEDLAEVGRLLREESLVTLTGVAGVGKTRLALKVAGERSDGAWLADLSAERNGALLAHTIGAAIGLKEQAARPQEDVLAEHLSGRRMLLILDTCEHLIGPCRALVGQILRAAPDVRVLATSREPLGLPGERVHTVRPLPVTEEDCDAVRLFRERARAVRPGFECSDAVVRLCGRLDGVPLALELAARRLRALTAGELLDRIDDRFSLLAGGGRTARHRTLRTAVGWSHELCTPEERLLWARLSVFGGTFGAEAAADVCSDEQLVNVPDLLARLVDKSVVIRHGQRFRMLDMMRDYGREWLHVLGEERLLARRHREHSLALRRGMRHPRRRDVGDPARRPESSRPHPGPGH
ncbi:ATP-binding protein [Microtetraspora glauca]|uniref:LuxR family transcriptional regulator n=1 Tax=Microtetraspora glauca TaxID=1996 RepID=A0ABV3G682_MICGL